MKYRADIDGLRAIAVLCVVIFHLDVTGFHGGYVGVDIFFVISGYLITSIIKRNFEDDNFQLTGFYIRRIRRLVPPLIATVAVTLAGSALVMTPYDLIATARSAAAALFSFSNIVFYLESGYWDAASELKPLLHTWSLGVEEQFYLFWPAIIIFLLGIRRRIAFGTSLTLISLVGGALCIAYTAIDQSAAFYLLPFRVFQFALGAWLITLISTARRVADRLPVWLPDLAFWSGLLCIAGSVFSFGEDTVFPGWAVLLPTIGGALVLLSGALPGRPGAPGSILLQNPVSVWLGRVSYSMYLVHWPVIVLFKYQYGLELSGADQLMLAAVTLLATCALHYGIERRFYQRNTPDTAGSGAVSDRRFVLQTVTLAGALALVASSAWLGDGWAWRFPVVVLSAEQIEQGKEDRFQLISRACTLKRDLSSEHCNFDAGLQVLVLGNSTEVDGYNFLHAGYGDDEDLNLILFGNASRCADWREESGRFLTSDAVCQNMLARLFDPEMIARLDVVFYSANMAYDENKSHFLAMLRELKSVNPGISIVTMGGYLINKRPCTYYVNKTKSTDACARSENVAYFEDDARKSGPLYNQFRELESHYVDRVDLLCRNRALENCLTRAEDGTPAFYDGFHNSLEFAQMSGRMYAEKYPSLLKHLAAQ